MCGVCARAPALRLRVPVAPGMQTDGRTGTYLSSQRLWLPRLGQGEGFHGSLSGARGGWL